MIGARVSFFCLLTLLIVLGRTHPSKETGNVAIPRHFQGIDSKIAQELHTNLRFDPPTVDFGVGSIGVARSYKVTLINEHTNSSVHLNSVSGRSAIFYSSFFESRVVPPLANTTFEVVFLPRKSEITTEYLLVHTSFGQANLLVRGGGFECPYRLQPIVDIKAPLNALLTPEIHMYNPHNKPLQIVEVYSSGGLFQLELPSGLASAPQTLWEIPPYTTKPIIRIKFHGSSAGNHTAYIRIKIATQVDDDIMQSKINGDEVLVVPVEFEILEEHGVYASNPVLDFGQTNTKPKKSLQLKIDLRNSNEPNKSRVIERVGLAEGESLIAGLKFVENDVSLMLEVDSFNQTTTLDELLVLQPKSKDNRSVGSPFTVRIRAKIFKGTLHYNRNTTIFITGVVRCKEGETRTLQLRNDFEVPVTFLSVKIGQNDANALQVNFNSDYYDGLTLQPGQFFDLLHLQLMNISVRHKSQLRIVTNATNFELPLVICTGRLHVTTHNAPILVPGGSYNSELNMGTVPLREMSQDGYVMLYNPNPIPVKLTNWNFKSPRGVYFHTKSMGCVPPAALEQFHKNQSVRIEHSSFRFCSQLNEGEISVFEIAIQSYVTELMTASLHVWTPYESIVTTVVFHTWIGKLEVDPEQLHFRNCFPGKICAAGLTLHSTFQHPIHITSINFTNSAIRFENEDSKNLIFALTPNAATQIGRIYFEPAIHCQNRCYLPMDELQNHLAFPKHLENSNNNFHFDEIELRRRTELYRQMKWHFRDILFTVYSRELRQLQLQANIDIEWPKLVKGGKIKFPIIETGKIQEQLITIRNPSEKPLLVDYFLSDPKYAQQTKLSLPLEVVYIFTSCYLTNKHVFFIRDDDDEVKSGVQILIPPYGKKDVIVRFEAPAKERDTYCTLLHLRNNLTLYEAVWLSARVVESQFRFGNRKPGSSTPLLYDLQEKHMAACPAAVIAKRTFPARNTGELPIWIETFLIDDQQCEGYGFKVLNCDGFLLKTNQSRKIEIAFRPDFTASRITRRLTIRTNLSYPIHYTLHAQLPPASVLEPCTLAIEQQQQQRPIWENQIRIIGLIIIWISLVFAIGSAYVDAESICMEQASQYLAREKGPVQPTFNLRDIAVKTSIISVSGEANNCIIKQQQQHQKSNQQSKRRSIGNNSITKKFSTIPSTTMSTANSHNCVDDLFCLTDFDETPAITSTHDDIYCFENIFSNDITSNIEDPCDCAPNFQTQKNTTPRTTDAVNSSSNKKPKSPQSLQNTMPKNRFNNKIKSRNSNLSTMTTPPPTQNPIIELMDKVEITDKLPDKRIDTFSKPTKALQKPIVVSSTDNNVEAISSKEIPTTPPKNIKRELAKVAPLTTAKQASLSSSFSSPTSQQQQQQLKSTVSTTAVIKTPSGTTSIISNAITKNGVFPTTTPNNTQQQQQITKIPKKPQSNQIKHGKTPGRERRKEKTAIASNKEQQHANVNALTLSAASSSSSLGSCSNGSNATKRTDRKEKKREVNRKIMPVRPLERSKPENLKNRNGPASSTVQTRVGTVFTSLAPVSPVSPFKKISSSSAQSSQSLSNIKSLFEVTGMQKFSLNDILEIANKSESRTMKKFGSNNSTPVSTDYESPLDKAMRHIDLKEKPKAIIKSMEPMRLQSIENTTNESEKYTQTNASELGPIGTKKSPSSTPVWESVVTSNSTTPIKGHAPLQPKLIDSNSFFSNFMNAPNVLADPSYDYNNPATSYMEGLSTSDLCELRKTQAELRRKLHANEYLLKVSQEQLKEQLRRQHNIQQQDVLHGICHTMPNWPTSDWVPLGFEAQRTLNMVENNDKMMNNNSNNNTGGNLTESPNHWQASMPRMRPPPGLGAPINSVNSLQQSNGQQTHNNNNNNTNGNNNHGSGGSSSNNNNNSQKVRDEARVFDPFSSLSSIWIDNWKQMNSKDGNQNGHKQ